MAVREIDNVTVRSARLSDAGALSRIYNYYVTESIVTFEEVPVSPDEIVRRVQEVSAFELPWLVGEHEGEILGFAYATKWKGRHAYRYSSETTVYIDPGRVGRGIGTRLYMGVLAGLRDRGIHAAMGGIALPNDASVALHEKLGFRKVAHFTEVGYKFDTWIDVAYWERLL